MNMNKKIVALFVVYMIAFVYSIIIAPAIAKEDHGILGSINKLHEKSLVSCDSCATFTAGRGDNYYIGRDMDEQKTEELKTSVVTFWSFLHFLM